MKTANELQITWPVIDFDAGPPFLVGESETRADSPDKVIGVDFDVRVRPIPR